MKTYVHYVHDIPEENHSWFSWAKAKRRNLADFKAKLNSKNDLQKALLQESNQTVLDYVSEHLDLGRNFRSIIFSSSNKSYVDDVDFNNVRAIINFRPINDIVQINEHFRSVNSLLPDAGIYIGRLETYWERKIRIFRKFGNVFGQMLWLVDFILNRVIAKMRPFDKVYKFFTNNKIHPISRAEILGRLVFSGFEIIEYKIIDNKFYFVVIKTGDPKINNEPSYHAIIKLKRIGKYGKVINVYKFRTMHPYSEFLQEYVFKLFGYNKRGKPAQDFRIARWGKLIRSIWLDELPQIINIFRGEMKLVGVRPLSRVRYNQFPEDLKCERIKYKPGCFPPYVALNMPDALGNIEAERIYLAAKYKHPFTADIRYFIKALFNIVTNKIRSS